MTDTRPQLVSDASISRTMALIAASVLIFTGIVFQLGQMGYGLLGANSLWVIHVIATNIWDLIAVHLDAPAAGRILEFWPLALVAIGLTILLGLKSECSVAAHRGSRDGENPCA